MKCVSLLVALLAFASSVIAQTITPYEADRSRNTSASYNQAIAFYQKLATEHTGTFRFTEHGGTDAGKPLHLGIVSKNGWFTPDEVRENGGIVLFVNNGIHPGEPVGIDATMMLVRDMLENNGRTVLPDNVVLVFIPVYNIGGALNRGPYSRANQVGPNEYGFRGNAQNLDLNRDFIKADSKNALTFNKVYSTWLPEIFIDNHTTNGADYQHAITLIATQHNKLGGPLSKFQQENLLPALYADMESNGWPMIPYVFHRGTPDGGIRDFLETPRYSSGYAALHHSLSFITEAHMLKPYQDRVSSIYQFMKSTLGYASANAEAITEVVRQQRFFMGHLTHLSINWRLDETRSEPLMFKGYQADTVKSEVTGLDRLVYDRSKPWEKEIPYQKFYRMSDSVEVPKAYIVPQGYHKVIERLQANGVQMRPLTQDSSIAVRHYKITDYQTIGSPFEGHYLHFGVQTEEISREWTFREVDMVILTDQPARRYIVETLEPRAPDSFFAWNFFDSILRQKEGFSDYIFEDLAAELLKNDAQLRADFQKRRSEDSTFAASSRAQLDFIYKRSPYYEPAHNLYPVARWF